MVAVKPHKMFEYSLHVRDDGVVDIVDVNQTYTQVDRRVTEAFGYRPENESAGICFPWGEKSDGSGFGFFSEILMQSGYAEDVEEVVEQFRKHSLNGLTVYTKGVNSPDGRQNDFMMFINDFLTGDEIAATIGNELTAGRHMYYMLRGRDAVEGDRYVQDEYREVFSPLAQNLVTSFGELVVLHDLKTSPEGLRKTLWGKIARDIRDGMCKATGAFPYKEIVEMFFKPDEEGIWKVVRESAFMGLPEDSEHRSFDITLDKSNPRRTEIISSVARGCPVDVVRFNIQMSGLPPGEIERYRGSFGNHNVILASRTA